MSDKVYFKVIHITRDKSEYFISKAEFDKN